MHISITNFLQRSRNYDASVTSKTHFTLKNKTLVTIYGPGVIEFEPAGGEDSIIYSCGIHGNETAPIEICDELVQDVLQEEVLLHHRLLVIFGNLDAMNKQTRFIDENLNRLFCNTHKEGKQNNERRRAAFLEQCVENFYAKDKGKVKRVHYDLHTAIRTSINDKFAVYPYTHGKAYSLEQLAIMSACGVNTILLSHSSTATFSYYSSHFFNANSFTVELGKVMPFGQNDMTKFEKVKTTLRHLITRIDSNSDFNLEGMVLYRVNQNIIKNQADFRLHFGNDAPNFTGFEKDEIIASETGKDYIAEKSGEAIVFPNADVPIGQRALLTVVPVSINEIDTI